MAQEPYPTLWAHIPALPEAGALRDRLRSPRRPPRSLVRVCMHALWAMRTSSSNACVSHQTYPAAAPYPRSYVCTRQTIHC